MSTILGAFSDMVKVSTLKLRLEVDSGLVNIGSINDRHQNVT